MTTDVNQFLMGSGARSWKHENKGDSVKGAIVSMEMRQQTDFMTKKPKFWDDGRPRMEAVVTLQTEEREDDEDDGLRRVYVRGQMQKAVTDAIRAAGARGLSEGGVLAIQFTGLGEKKQGMNPPKLYRARYEAPTFTPPAAEDEWADAEPF